VSSRLVNKLAVCLIILHEVLRRRVFRNADIESKEEGKGLTF